MKRVAIIDSKDDTDFLVDKMLDVMIQSFEELSKQDGEANGRMILFELDVSYVE